MTYKEIIREIPDDPHALRLYQQQEAMEYAAYELAQKRVKEQILQSKQKGQEGTGKVAGSMAALGIGALLEYIENWMDELTAAAQADKRVAKSTECNLLPHYREMKEKGVLLDFVSSSLGSCFNGITQGKAATSVAFDIARRAEHALMLEAARKADKELRKQIILAASRKGGERRKQNTIRFMVKVRGVEWEPWGKQKQGDFGQQFLRMVVNSGLGYFHIAKRYDGVKSIDYLTPTDEASEWMRKREQNLLETACQYEPMVFPPRPWAPGVTSGAGYLTHAQLPLLLVKKKGRKYLKQLEALQDPRMDTFYKGLNAAQTTGWRIRKPILAQLHAMMETGNNMDLLPPLKPEDIPPAPETAAQAKALMKDWKPDKGNREVWIEENLKEDEQRIALSFIEWKRNVARIQAANAKQKGQRVGLLRNVATADRLQGYESIYFPYQVDFRGRVYAATQGGLSPQGEDYIKALLEFDKGMALGEMGWEFLRWHTANVWGEDKLGHNERIQWADESMDVIQAWAENPMDTSICIPTRDGKAKHWTDADKPFQFLACCFELNEAMKLENPEEYVSHMPIAMDGSCSGLQHMGMATRCEDTAWAVNIVDSEYTYSPSDIYQDVADIVAERLHEIANGKKYKKQWGEEQAKKWIEWGEVWKKDKLSRSVTKRPVMTYSYGATQHGFGEQVMEDTIAPAAQKADKKRDSTFTWPTYRERYQAADFMASLIWDAVKETVKIPAQITEWLRDVAKMTSKDAPLTWTTPLGFPVEQDNPKRKSVSVDFTMRDGTRVRHSFNEDRPEQAIQDRVKGITPNIVHSLDASHLLMTVAAAMDEGIEHFALIHDSFGTHAANAHLLNYIVKAQMVELYKGDYFDELRQELIPQVRPEMLAKMPELPKRGDLNIETVLSSEFSFA